MTDEGQILFSSGFCDDAALETAHNIIRECGDHVQRARELLNALCRPVKEHPLGEWHVFATAPGSSLSMSARSTLICRIGPLDVIAMYC